MKIKIFAFNNNIIFDEEHVNILEVYDKKLFSSLTFNLNELASGRKSFENILLFEGEEVIEIQKNIIAILDPLNPSFNNRKISTDLYQKLSGIFIQEFGLQAVFQECKGQLLYIIQNLCQEMPLEFRYKDSIEIQDILKLYELKIDMSTSTSIIDKVFLIMDILAFFNLYKVIIFINLKSFLDEDDLVEIYKYAKYKKLNILLIESNASKRLAYEKKIIIDENFDDFLIN